MIKLLYGVVSLNSEACPDCGYDAFVVDGALVCCGRPATKPPHKWKRMSLARNQRTNFSLAFRDSLVDTQHNECFWCGIRFDRQEWRNGKPVRKQIHIEHIEPFIYASNEAEQNLVASCSICNLIKSCLMFKDTHECREYIRTKRILKGYTTRRPDCELSDVREAIRASA